MRRPNFLLTEKKSKSDLIGMRETDILRRCEASVEPTRKVAEESEVLRSGQNSKTTGSVLALVTIVSGTLVIATVAF